MADSINDVVLEGEEWQDVYDATSISVGTALIIQNKTSSDVFTWIGTTKPADDFRQGFVLFPNPKDPAAAYQLTSGESGLWVFGKGPISVQEG